MSRRTLNRNSIRRKKEDGERAAADDEPLSFEKKSSTDWKSRLASKFMKGGGDGYDLEGSERKNSNDTGSAERLVFPPSVLLTKSLIRDTFNQFLYFIKGK